MYCSDDYDWEPAPLPAFVQRTNPCSWESNMSDGVSNTDSTQNADIAVLGSRVTTLEGQMAELRTSTNELVKSTSSIAGAVDTLKTVVYAILSVTVITVLGMVVKMAIGG